MYHSALCFALADRLEVFADMKITQVVIKLVNRYKQRQIKPYCVTWEDKAIPQKPQGNIRIFENEPAEALKLVKEVKSSKDGEY